MATTQLARVIRYDVSVRGSPNKSQNGNVLRMNWVVVTDTNGARRLRMQWLAAADR